MSALPRNVILAGVALILAIIVVHGYEAWQSYRNALEAPDAVRVLANWRHDELWALARTSAIVLFTVILLAALIAALRQQERSDRRRRRLEKQWRQTVQADSLGMFAASITHDFNNVLSAIVEIGRAHV